MARRTTRRTTTRRSRTTRRGSPGYSTGRTLLIAAGGAAIVFGAWWVYQRAKAPALMARQQRIDTAAAQLQDLSLEYADVVARSGENSPEAQAVAARLAQAQQAVDAAYRS